MYILWFLVTAIYTNNSCPPLHLRGLSNSPDSYTHQHSPKDEAKPKCIQQNSGFGRKNHHPTGPFVQLRGV